jgi:hypothetical protein
MISRELPGVLLLVVAAGFVVAGACSSQPPVPSGNLLRPRDLISVPRAFDAAINSARSDLYIADSEAQGVRVVQLAESGNSYSQAFVSAPSVYFPLVIPAPGFPSRLAITATSAKDRLYVLSSQGELPLTGGARDGRSTVHIQYVSEAPFGAGASQTLDRRIGEIRLDELFPADWLPVDIEVLFQRDDGRDVIAIAFDVTDGADAHIGFFEVPRDLPGFEVVITQVETATVAGGPRSMLFADDTVFVSSAATSSVSLVEIDSRRPVGSLVVSDTPIDVSGPTTSLISVGEEGVLAVRRDRASVVLLEPNASGSWQVADRYFPSPFTAKEERLQPSSLGRIDLRDVPLVSGASQRLARLVTPKNQGQPDPVVELIRAEDLGGDGKTEAVLLVHVDGIASVLVGSPLRLALESEAQVSGLRVIDSLDVSVTQCAEVPLLCDEPNATAVAPSCDLSVVDGDAADNQSYRLWSQGSLLQSRTGFLEPLSTSTSAASVAFLLRDVGLGTEAYAGRQIEVGDHVLTQLRVPLSCELTFPVQIVDTGTITGVLPNQLTVEYAGAVRGLLPCAGAVLPFQGVSVYEVFPPENTAVFGRLSGSNQVEVLSRLPVEPLNDGAEQIVVDSEITFTAVAPSGFACRIVEGQGAPCASNTAAVDCGPGRLCQLGEQRSEGCLARCTDACLSTETCLPAERVRQCPRLELAVQGTRPFLIDLRAGGNQDGVTLFDPAGPSEVVVARERKAWFVSFAGSRGLAEVRVNEDGRVSVFQTR